MKNFKFMHFLLAASIVLLFLSSCRFYSVRKINPLVIDGFSSPESVIFDKVNNIFFVSNVGKKLEPTSKDSDGFISKVSPEGVMLVKNYFPENGILHAPKGMAIIGRSLYVTDIDRVVGFKIDTREKFFELDFSSEHTHFLNDLTVFDKNTLIVSATDIGKIYKITLKDQGSYEIVAENIAGVNGLYYEKETKELFIVSFGGGEKKKGLLGVIVFNRHNLRFKKLTEELGLLDGVSVTRSSKILFSDWVEIGKPGVIRVYDILTKELSTISLSQSVKGPADFFYDEETQRIWIPKMLEGQVLVEQVRE